MLKAPQNLFATAYDGSVRSDWQTVEGADGYILQFYNADEPEKCIKTRYAQNNSKLILGFRNGRKYLVRVKRSAIVTEKRYTANCHSRQNLRRCAITLKLRM